MFDIEMMCLEVWDFEKQNNEMFLKWGSLKNKIIFEIVIDIIWGLGFKWGSLKCSFDVGDLMAGS